MRIGNKRLQESDVVGRGKRYADKQFLDKEKNALRVSDGVQCIYVWWRSNCRTHFNIVIRATQPKKCVRSLQGMVARLRQLSHYERRG